MQRQSHQQQRPITFAQIELTRTANSCKTMEELFIALAKRGGVERIQAKKDYRDYRERFLEQLPFEKPPEYIAAGVDAAVRADTRPAYLREGTPMAAMSAA